VLTCLQQSDGEEPTSPVPQADEVELPADAAGSSGNMSVLDALKGTFIKKISKDLIVDLAFEMI
jgi:hypothetical protein